MKASLLAAILALGLSACSAVHPHPLSPGPAAGLRAGSRLIITPLRGEPFDMKLDEVRNDTLFGFTRARNVRVPLSEVRSVSVRKFAVGRTLGLAIPSGVILAATLWAFGVQDVVTDFGKTVADWF